MSTSQAVKFDINLLHKYNQPVPRYTSYPPATELSENFDEMDFRGVIASGNLQKTPLSLYAHIPFCDAPCYFCGCNTVISTRKEIAEPYLGYLMRHIEQVAATVDLSIKWNVCGIVCKSVLPLQPMQKSPSK